jgi:DNA-binding transcriptional regulator YdaS (Cro superfamily)
MRGIDRVIEIVGSQSELARRLNVTQQAVQQWVEAGTVPPRRCAEVAAIVENQVSLHQLNPDVFPNGAPR